MTIRHEPDAGEHTLTHREVMAARDTDIPGNGRTLIREPRNGRTGTDTTPKHGESHTA